MARRINIHDDEDVVERDYRTDDQDNGTNWLPLLIVPLLLGGLLWGLQSYSQNAVDRNNPGGQEFGVGGAPVVTQSVSPTPIVSPTVSPTMMQDDTLMPINEMSPTDVVDENL